MRRTLPSIAALSILAAASATAVAAPVTTVRLDVDARDAPRKLFRVTETIPVAAGAVRLAYPKWIPGEHGPTGPIADLAGLEISAAGKRLAWTRDPLDMYIIQVDAPPATTALTIKLELLSPTATAGFTSAAGATPELALINWNQLLLFPATARADDVAVTATLRLPAGWKHGSALPTARVSGDTVTFKPVTLTTLVDSPVLAGAHTRTVELSKAPPMRMFIAADADAALDFGDDIVKGHQALVAEALALFGARHFDSYTFLVTLSDATAHFGLEHHESSDNRMPERGFVDSDTRRVWAGLLAHELAHSWNGKHRRPTGLATASFGEPVDSSMLWVYEGLTQYLGWVLATRSGLMSAADARDMLARTAARMEAQTGRSWRPLVDTAAAAQILYGAPEAWEARRRSVDFYPEGLLLWLEVDGIIRRESKGKKSLDDLCRDFFGGKDSGAVVAPYSFDELVAALQAVAPFDWRQHLTTRTAMTAAHAPTDGIGLAGWTLEFQAAVPDYMKARESVSDDTSVWHSLGIDVRKSGEIIDVRPGSPADTAGVAPSGTVVGVNNRTWNRERLRSMIAATTTRKKIELLVVTGDFFKTYVLTYAGGERYPQLVRTDKRPDGLAQILAARR